MKQQEKILKALSNVTRLKIILFLREKEPASVAKISESTKCSYKAASKHLSILFRVDLVNRDQKGYEMHYRLAEDMNLFARKIVDMIN